MVTETPITTLKAEEPRSTFSQSHWEWFGLAMIVLVAAGMRLWKLGQNSFGNTYYSAAVRSMSQSWHNFFFASFDPAGYVTVDKPPVALWVQVASVKLFGYSSFIVLLPQVLEGLLSVVLVYYLVRRRFDTWAALLAGLAMAVAPICVAIDRYNNVDSCLVTVLMLAAWAVSLAAETGSLKLLLLALGLVGVGFNVKMMAAFVVLPVFYILYFTGAPVTWKKRLMDLTLASVVLVTVALSWPLFVDLTPPDLRPFVGSTQDNSMISLSLGWNGFQRLLSRRRGNLAGLEEERVISPVPRSTPAAQGFRNSGNRNFNRRGEFMGSGTPGPLRLVERQMAGQILWFFPLALVGFLVALPQTRQTWPLSPAHQALLLWAGWFLTYALVFSFMRGAMHTYYLVMLAPPLSALAGIGTRSIWLSFKNSRWLLMPLSLLLTAVWQVYILIQYPSWMVWLLPILVAGTGIAVVCMIRQCLLVRKQGSSRSLCPALSVGLITLFLCPVAWSLTPLLAKHASPEANPDLLAQNQPQNAPGFGFGSTEMNNEKLVAFLQANRHGEKYIMAAQSVQPVAPIIIKTGEPAVSLGGFMGGDPVVTLEQFIQMIKNQQLRYMMLSGFDRSNRPGNQYTAQPRPNGQNNWGYGMPNGYGVDISNWVRKHGKPVNPKLWRSGEENARIAALMEKEPLNASNPFFGSRGGRRGGGTQLYDLAGARP